MKPTVQEYNHKSEYRKALRIYNHLNSVIGYEGKIRLYDINSEKAKNSVEKMGALYDALNSTYEKHVLEDYENKSHSEKEGELKEKLKEFRKSIIDHLGLEEENLEGISNDSIIRNARWIIKIMK